MRYGLLLVLIALVVILVLSLNKGRQGDPVAQGMAALDKVKTTTLELDMNNVSAAINKYLDDHNEYPDNLDMLLPKYLTTANFLLDSWGTPLSIEKDDQQNFFLVSAGPDRVFATSDDSRRRLQ